jgi:hypothetical protein
MRELAVEKVSRPLLTPRRTLTMLRLHSHCDRSGCRRPGHSKTQRSAVSSTRSTRSALSWMSGIPSRLLTVVGVWHPRRIIQR